MRRSSGTGRRGRRGEARQLDGGARMVILACALIPLCASIAHADQAPSALPKRQLAPLQAHLAGELALAGRQSGAEAFDISTGQQLFAERADQRHPPASVEKLYTATAALALLGPSAHLRTAVYGVGELSGEGTWRGDLYLRGGGDPTFGSASFIASHYHGTGTSVQALARMLYSAGIRRTTGTIYGDETLFDSRRGEPSSAWRFDPFLEGVLSALAFNRGEHGSYGGAHAPAKFAATQLARALGALGIHTSGRIDAAPTPADARSLAVAPSPSLARLLALMLPPSDNFFAEMLVKYLGARFGGTESAGSTGATGSAGATGATGSAGATGAAGTAGSSGSPAGAGEAGGVGSRGGPASTTAGALIVAGEIAKLTGLRPRIVDGSGLSAADQTAPREVLALLRYLAAAPFGSLLRSSLAIASRSGTLSERMLHSAASGRCQAKTGTLTGVSNLAGYCTAADGRLIAFAIFNDGVEVPAAHTIQDDMAITLARL